MGLLDIRVFGPLMGKKISLILGWGLWEVLLTLALLTWGHFRSNSLIGEPTDLENIKLPRPVLGLGTLKYKGWLLDQLEFRRTELVRRLKSLELSELEMNNDQNKVVPPVLLGKLKTEIAALKEIIRII